MKKLLIELSRPDPLLDAEKIASHFCRAFDTDSSNLSKKKKKVPGEIGTLAIPEIGTWCHREAAVVRAAVFARAGRAARLCHATYRSEKAPLPPPRLRARALVPRTAGWT
jgi:hypothetical protein